MKCPQKERAPQSISGPNPHQKDGAGRLCVPLDVIYVSRLQKYTMTHIRIRTCTRGPMCKSVQSHGHTHTHTHTESVIPKGYYVFLSRVDQSGVNT